MAGFDDFPLAQPAATAPAANGADPWAAFPTVAEPAAAPAASGPGYLASSLLKWERGGPGDSAATEAAPAQPSVPFTLSGLLASLGDGAREGIALSTGGIVDAVNNAPRLANLIPGVSGVGPMTDHPFLGSKDVDKGLRLGGIIPDYQPQNGAERITNRVGQEIGATTVPVLGGMASVAGRTAAEVNRMANAPRSLAEGLHGTFIQPLSVNPAGTLNREMAYATAAGAGAGAANELADKTGAGHGWLSDLLGSIGGVGTLATGHAVGGALANLGKTIVGAPATTNSIALEEVANRLINNSSVMQGQHVRGTSQLDTTPLVASLRRQAPVEQQIPGYQANIADRTADPALATLAYNADGRIPGAAAVRRAGNDAAVDGAMAALAPDGSPARFRGDLQSGVDRQIADALGQQSVAQDTFDSAVQGVTPQIPTASARGSLVRSGLADAYDTAQQGVRDAYGKLNDTGTLVNPEPLVKGAQQVDVNLAPNDAMHFRPPEADTIKNMLPVDSAPYRNTGLVNEYNRPVFSESRPPQSANGAVAPQGAQSPARTVPLSDVLATRSGLTNRARVAAASGDTRSAAISGQYTDQIDNFLAQALDPESKAIYDQARAARRDVGDRFERPGTAHAATLKTRQGGGYAMDDSAVAGRYAQPDNGRLSDLKSLLSEAGTDERVRDGLSNEVMADVEKRGLINRPDALGKYLGERKVLMGEFPELRSKLEAAGASKAQLDTVSEVAKKVQRDLTTPGRSPEASYLQYGDSRAIDAVRTVTNAKDPAAAAKQLMQTADSPTAVQDMRSALWQDVAERGKFSAKGSTGQERWNGRTLAEAVNDPKFDAVAKELWKDDPEGLANIKNVANALAGAEGSSRARAPGSSGTGQVLAGKHDPALTAASISSRGRSVSRGQLSPTIAIVDLSATALRRRSARLQSSAIDDIMSRVVNNPGMAADLLEKYNPATYPAYRRMMVQKYGVRATEILNIIDAERNNDPTVDALQEGK